MNAEIRVLIKVRKAAERMAIKYSVAKTPEHEAVSAAFNDFAIIISTDIDKTIAKQKVINRGQRVG